MQTSQDLLSVLERVHRDTKLEKLPPPNIALLQAKEKLLHKLVEMISMETVVDKNGNPIYHIRKETDPNTWDYRMRVATEAQPRLVSNTVMVSIVSTYGDSSMLNEVEGQVRASCIQKVRDPKTQKEIFFASLVGVHDASLIMQNLPPSANATLRL